MWEQSKENVQPVARGRSARKLGEVSDVALKARIIEDKNDTFEQLLRVAKLAVESDSTVETQTVVLTTYMSYSKWARENSPSSHEPCKKILERATEDMKGYTTLKNDPRFIKLWIEYADMLAMPGEVFSFMQSNKIGERVALFWIAWAYMAEKIGNYELTEQIFKKGIKKLAEPKKLIEGRFSQFQRRMARKIQEDTANGVLPGSSSSSNRDAGSKNKKERKVLKSIKKHKTSNPTQGGLGNQNNTTSSSSTAVAGHNALSGFGSNFQIFSDTASPSTQEVAITTETTETIATTGTDFATTVTGVVTENADWTELKPEGQRIKENTGLATTWNDPLKMKKQDAVAPAAPAFAFFTDDQFIEGNDVNNEVSSTTEDDHNAMVENKNENVTEMAIEVSSQELDHNLHNDTIVAKDNDNNTNENEEGTEAATETKGKMHVDTMETIEQQQKKTEDLFVDEFFANLEECDGEDGTINTRLAAGTINAMFSSPVASPVRETAPAVKNTGSANGSIPFAVFEDGVDDNEVQQVAPSKVVGHQTNQPFTIFED